MVHKLFKIAGLIITFMVVAGISTYLTIHLLIRGGDTVMVPELEGREVVYALEVLSDLGLNTKVKGSEFNAKVPRNHVIAQEPEAGTEIKRGRDVRLVLSKGAQTVVFPNLTGLSVPQARIVLDENGLQQGKLSYIYDDNQAGERILTQFPQPGITGLRGEAVNLLVSQGPSPQRIKMVNLEGMEVRRATIILEDNRLSLGSIKHVFDPLQPDNTVVSQSPEYGFPVMSHTAVALTISRSREKEALIDTESTALFRYHVPEGFLKQYIRVRLNKPDSSMDIYNDYARPGSEIWVIVPQTGPTTLFLYVDNDLITTKHFNTGEINDIDRPFDIIR